MFATLSANICKESPYPDISRATKCHREEAVKVILSIYKLCQV